MFLRVIYLSHSTEPGGKIINPLFYSENFPKFLTSKYRLSIQSNSLPKAWKVCTTILRNMLNIQKDYTLSLHHKLQQWLIPSSQRHMTHKWYYDSNQEEIYHNQNQKILHYFKRQLSYNVIEHNLDSETKTDLILDNVTPITIVKKILLLPSILFNTHNTIHLKNLKTTYITFARVKKNTYQKR